MIVKATGIAALLLLPLALLADVTVTPGTWDLYRSSTIVARAFPTLEACAKAADDRNELRTYTCRTRATVVVTADAQPVPPPVPTPIPPPSGATFFDRFDYELPRSANAATFAATVRAAGWAGGKTESTEPNRSWGYAYTATASEIPGPCGVFPTASQRALVLEGRPASSPAQPGFPGQTDYFAAYGGARGAIPADGWVQFWLCNVDSGAMTSQFAIRNKFFYANNSTQYPATNGNPDYETYDILAGSTGCEEFNPANRSWVHGAVRNRLYFCNEAFGARNTLQNETPYGSEYLYHNLSPTTAVEPNTWTLVRWRTNLSGAQGTWDLWLRKFGQSWVHVSSFRGGVTPGFTWPTTAQQRLGPAAVRIPTTENSNVFAGVTIDGDNWKLIDDLYIAASESALPRYADEP